MISPLFRQTSAPPSLAQRLENRLTHLGYVYNPQPLSISAARQDMQVNAPDGAYLHSAYELIGRPAKRVLVFSDFTGDRQTLLFQERTRGGWNAVERMGRDAFLRDDRLARRARGSISSELRLFAGRLRTFQPEGCHFLLTKSTDDVPAQIFSGFSRRNGAMGPQYRLRMPIVAGSDDPAVYIERKGITDRQWNFLHGTTVSRLNKDPVYSNDVDLASLTKHLSGPLAMPSGDVGGTTPLPERRGFWRKLGF